MSDIVFARFIVSKRREYDNKGTAVGSNYVGAIQHYSDDIK